MDTASSAFEPDCLLTEGQAALLLNLSIRTLQAWRCRHSGPAYVRAGRTIRYRRCDLVEWISANVVPATNCGTSAERQRMSTP
jgi:hypothetical protein